MYLTKLFIRTFILLIFFVVFCKTTIMYTYYTITRLHTYYDMQNWEPAPATINDLKMEKHKEKIHTPKYGTETKEYIDVVATYNYLFNNKTYTSDRVAIYNDNDSHSYYENIYKELSKIKEDKKQTTAYVNPNTPSQAVLYRELDWEEMYWQIFAAIFFIVLFILITSSLIYHIYLIKTESVK